MATYSYPMSSILPLNANRFGTRKLTQNQEDAMYNILTGKRTLHSTGHNKRYADMMIVILCIIERIDIRQELLHYYRRNRTRNSNDKMCDFNDFMRDLNSRAWDALARFLERFPNRFLAVDLFFTSFLEMKEIFEKAVTACRNDRPDSEILECLLPCFLSVDCPNRPSESIFKSSWVSFNKNVCVSLTYASENAYFTCDCEITTHVLSKQLLSLSIPDAVTILCRLHSDFGEKLREFLMLPLDGEKFKKEVNDNIKENHDQFVRRLDRERSLCPQNDTYALIDRAMFFIKYLACKKRIDWRLFCRHCFNCDYPQLQIPYDCHRCAEKSPSACDNATESLISLSPPPAPTVPETPLTCTKGCTVNANQYVVSVRDRCPICRNGQLLLCASDVLVPAQPAVSAQRSKKKKASQNNKKKFQRQKQQNTLQPPPREEKSKEHQNPPSTTSTTPAIAYNPDEIAAILPPKAERDSELPAPKQSKKAAKFKKAVLSLEEFNKSLQL